MVSPGRKIQPQLRPLFGQLSRFIGLLAVASVWIKLCLLGSNEFFGEKATLDELMLGGRSADVDIGFGGDYLGWGEIDLDQQGGRGGSSVTLDFAELADIVEELVKVGSFTLDGWGGLLGCRAFLIPLTLSSIFLIGVECCLRYFWYICG
jgi:hypothetical protein